MARPALTLIVLALLSVSSLAGCASLPPEVARAKSLLERGAYGDADSAAQTAMATYPEHPTLWRVRIQAAMGQRDAQRAVALYRQWHKRRGEDDHTALERLALTTLWQGLRVPSARVQADTIQAIERLEVEKLAREVSSRITDDEDLVAAAASVALLRSDVSAPRVAAQLLTSEVAEARAIVVEGIGRKVGKRARSDLVRALADPAPAVRQRAIDAVAALKDRRDNAAFRALAQRDRDPSVRAAAVRALASARADVRRAAATRALGDEDLRVRLAAVQILARSSQASDIAALQKAAQSSDLPLALRAAALQQPGKRDAARALGFAPLLQRALSDPAPAIQAAALEVAAELAGSARARDLCGQKLGHQSPQVRLAAARTLAILGDSRGAGALGTLAASAVDPDIRKAAVAAHAEAKKLTPGLIAALADSSARIRIATAEAILRVLE